MAPHRTRPRLLTKGDILDVSKWFAMGIPDPAHREADRIRALAERAARVQDLLGDLEVSLLPAGETRGLRLLRDLKAAWREFKDDAMRGRPYDLR